MMRVADTQDNGNIIKWRVVEPYTTQMVKLPMKVSGWQINSMVPESYIMSILNTYQHRLMEVSLILWIAIGLNMKATLKMI